jgi:ParB family chromosome partitioning protein
MVYLDKIIVNSNGRKPKGVEALKESIADLGLLQPLILDENFHLVAGRTRKAALEALGAKQAPCRIMALDSLHAQLATIDENLKRSELSHLERAEQVKRRKEIYEALHPEAAVRPNGGRPPKNGETISSFTEDMAAKTGSSRRSVQQGVQIAENLSEATKDLVRGTPVEDNKTQLMALSRVAQQEQEAAAKEMVEADKTNRKKSRASKPQSTNKASAAAKSSSPQVLSEAWKEADEALRREFLVGLIRQPEVAALIQKLLQEVRGADQGSTPHETAGAG